MRAWAGQANLIVTDGPGNTATAMEGAGGMGAVNEMLLQSHTERGFELFPQVCAASAAAEVHGTLLVTSWCPLHCVN